MRFLLMLRQDEGAWGKAPAGEGDRVAAAYSALEDELKRRGAYVDSVRLRFSDQARSLRYRSDGTTEVTDGPFDRAREQLGGFYLLECGSLDEALAWAKRMPNYRHGGIEIRPIWD
jgi:hypothetical protein